LLLTESVENSSLNIEINTSSPITTVHAPEILKREENGLIKK